MEPSEILDYSRSLATKLGASNRPEDNLMTSTAHEWLRLMDMPHPDPSEIENLLQTLSEHQDDGSVWYEMYLFCQKWKSLVLADR
jgi:hypothetical protein